jgi:hypothetical protein
MRGEGTLKSLTFSDDGIWSPEYAVLLSALRNAGKNRGPGNMEKTVANVFSSIPAKNYVASRGGYI